jgi:peroxygenase
MQRQPQMVYSNMNVMDPAGWIAERLEWYMMYLLCKDDNGIVSKEKIRAQYDGTLWVSV